MTNTLENARTREREYHVDYYRDHQLGDTDTWLAQPARYALDSLAYVKTDQAAVLDLGCGIGRHTFPILEAMGSNSRVVGVDILPEAIDILRASAEHVSVSDRVSSEVSDVAAYDYGVDRFDMVLSVSCIEHVSSLDELHRVLGRIQLATRPGGVNCFMIGTDVAWYSKKREQPITPVIEFPLQSAELIPLLKQAYASWTIADLSKKNWSVADIIDGEEIVNSSVCIQLTAIRPEED